MWVVTFGDEPKHRKLINLNHIAYIERTETNTLLEYVVYFASGEKETLAMAIIPDNLAKKPYHQIIEQAYIKLIDALRNDNVFFDMNEG